MKKVLYYLKKVGIFIGILILFSAITSLLNLLGLSKNISSVITFIFQLLLFLVLGFIHGKKTNKKGFLQGIKVASILILLMWLLSILLYKYNFKISNLVYYVILSLASITGAIIGKNKK